MISSIHSRIILSALIVLVLFMSLTGAVLDKAFINNVEQSQHENLRTQIYTLLATAELDDNSKLQLPAEVTEPRLNMYESTLHARILTVADKVVWQSKSMTNIKLPFPTGIKMGEFSFSKKQQGNNNYNLINLTTIWITEKGEHAYIFQIAENASVLEEQITLFRNSLWLWLLGVSLLLIIVQTIILHWGLKPLRHVTEDLIAIEKGDKKRLSGKYPKEIHSLTQNLNQLLDSSQQQLIRYRDALGNMAHSLKTPIAVLQGIISNTDIEEKNTSLEQLKTINSIVDYQLQRAATLGNSQLSENTALLACVEKTVATLDKIYRDKKIQSTITIAETLNIKMNKGDVFEMLGNLIENAFKWSKGKVYIHAKIIGDKVQLIIEDDGIGIDSKQAERILLRGQRADENTPGHGLGLAMVMDMLLLYGGSLKIERSTLGGAKMLVII